MDRERIGYMPQDFVMYPALTVEETLHFAASLYGVPWGEAARRTKELLRFVDLEDAHKRRAGDLSGGMRRRLSLAATLVHDPDFLVLDEPTAGIDPILRVTIWEGLQEARESGKTLVVTTQYITEAEYCDAVLLIYEGVIIASGTPEQLRHAATGGDMLDVRLLQPIEPEMAERLRNLPFVVAVEGRQRPDELLVTVHSLTNDLPLLAAFFELEAGGLAVMEPYVPSFEDVFVRLVNHARAMQEEPTMATRSQPRTRTSPLNRVQRTAVRNVAFTAKELHELLRQPQLLLGLVIGPFLILFLFGAGFKGQVVDQPTVLVVP